MLDEAYEFRYWGYNVMLVDFRGHGNSDGEVTTLGMKESEEVKLAFDHISKTGEKNIILWGMSLGAVIITKAIWQYDLKPQKIILEIDRPGTTSSGIENLSISVSPVAAFSEQGINDYMVFGSEFGVIPDEIKNHKLSELSPLIINEFLSGTKSSWIDWERIMSGNLETTYPMENEYHFLSGRLVSMDQAIKETQEACQKIYDKNNK
jgi:hypothetical protein